ncbi:hypothetical protein ACSSS7_004941 [Eimeria intestinalis]
MHARPDCEVKEREDEAFYEALRLQESRDNRSLHADSSKKRHREETLSPASSHQEDKAHTPPSLEEIQQQMASWKRASEGGRIRQQSAPQEPPTRRKPGRHQQQQQQEQQQQQQDRQKHQGHQHEWRLGLEDEGLNPPSAPHAVKDLQAIEYTLKTAKTRESAAAAAAAASASAAAPAVATARAVVAAAAVRFPSTPTSDECRMPRGPTRRCCSYGPPSPKVYVRC